MYNQKLSFRDLLYLNLFFVQNVTIFSMRLSTEPSQMTSHTKKKRRAGAIKQIKHRGGNKICHYS